MENTVQIHKLRFPLNLVIAATQREKSSLNNLQNQARTRGLHAARAWVLSCFEFKSNVDEQDRTCELDISLPQPINPTKLVFVQTLALVIDALEARYGFDVSNGYVQVLYKDISTNEAYGFYEELNQIADNFNLWDALPKR